MLEMKPYCQGHLDFIHDIDIKSYDEVWEPEQLHKAGSKIKVCVSDDEVIGFYLVDPVAKLGRVLKFGVKPSRRREGVGSFMLDQLILISLDLETLSTVVSEFNLPAQLFLKANFFGFKRQLRKEDGINYLFTKQL